MNFENICKTETFQTFTDESMKYVMKISYIIGNTIVSTVILPYTTGHVST